MICGCTSWQGVPSRSIADMACPLAQRADMECAHWLADAQVPFSLVFTKTDKRKKKCPSPSDNIQAFQVRRAATCAESLICRRGRMPPERCECCPAGGAAAGF